MAPILGPRSGVSYMRLLGHESERLCCIIKPIVVRKTDSFAVLWPLGVRNADALRHAQVRHPIERRTPNPHLGRLGRHLPTAQTVAKEHFLTEHHRFGQTPTVIVDLLFPPGASNLTNPLHRFLTRIPLPNVLITAFSRGGIAGLACRAAIA